LCRKQTRATFRTQCITSKVLAKKILPTKKRKSKSFVSQFFSGSTNGITLKNKVGFGVGLYKIFIFKDCCLKDLFFY
jgi:hypothetical protein